MNATQCAMGQWLDQYEASRNKTDIGQRMLSMESFTDGNKGGILSRLNSFMLDAKQKISQGFVLNADIKILGFKSDYNLVKKVQRAGFPVVAKIPVPVPSTMRAPMLDVIHILEAAQDTCIEIQMVTLEPAIAYFAQLLNEPEMLSSVSNHGGVSTIRFHEKEIEETKTDLKRAFSNPNNQSGGTAPFQQVFLRIKDWEESQERLHKLTTNASKIKLSSIQEDIHTLSDLIDRLMIRMKQKPESYGLTSTNVTKLSETVMKIADEVAFIGSTRLLIESMEQTMNEIGNVLNDALV